MIDSLSVKKRQREQKAQETFDRTLAGISRQVLSIAVIFLGIILSAGVLIALSIRLPLQPSAAMRDHLRQLQCHSGRQPRTRSARWRARWGVPRRHRQSKTEDELRASREKAGALCSNLPPSKT